MCVFCGFLCNFAAMKINPVNKLREIVGEHLILLQGKSGGDMSKVVAFNETSVLLWESLLGREFETEDVKQILLDNYEVDESTAAKDAAEWVRTLRENDLLMPEGGK